MKAMGNSLQTFPRESSMGLQELNKGDYERNHSFPGQL